MIAKCNKLILSLFFVFICLNSFSEDTHRNIYSGGMLMLQPGFTMTDNGYQKVSDMSSGLGGILRIYFSKNLTAGIYGGTINTNYNSTGSENSYMRAGYGGPFFGYSKKSGKIRYTASAFAGMGSIRNLHIESQTSEVLNEAYFRKYPAFLVSPILSMDYAMTSKISFTLQGVFIVGKYDKDKYLYNPVLQLGILFNR
jgi:hypothetical protein